MQARTTKKSTALRKVVIVVLMLFGVFATYLAFGIGKTFSWFSNTDEVSLTITAGKWITNVQTNPADLDTPTLAGTSLSFNYPETGFTTVTITVDGASYTQVATTTTSPDESPLYTISDINLLPNTGGTKQVKIQLSDGTTTTPEFLHSIYINGTGTENNPYLVRDFDDFRLVGRDLANLTSKADYDSYSRFYRQTADFTITAGFVTPGSYNTLNVGGFDASMHFLGTYDGGDHTISGLSHADGLFGRLGFNSTVKNLKLAAVNINAPADNVGALCKDNFGAIDNVHILDGTVMARGQVAGIAGYSSGAITNSSNAATINHTSNIDYAGGIVAYSQGQITNCQNKGAISGNYAVGGIVGIINSTIPLTLCTNFDTASVYSQYGAAGGIAGLLIATNISDNINFGSVIADGDNTGGVVGYAPYPEERNGFSGYATSTIERCGNNGTVQGTDSVGGIVGGTRGSVYHSFNKADISGGSKVGGIVGYAQPANNRPVINVDINYNRGTITASGSMSGGIAGAIWNASGTSSEILYAYTTGELLGAGTSKALAAGSSDSVCYVRSNLDGVFVTQNNVWNCQKFASSDPASMTAEMNGLTDQPHPSAEILTWKTDTDGVNGGFPLLWWE